MMNSSVDDKGRKITDRGNVALSTDVVKLLKTQDAGYIRTMLQVTRKEREELEQRLILEEQGEARALKDGREAKKGKHRVFVDNEEEQEEFDPEAWFGRGEEMPTKAKEQVEPQWTDEDEEDGSQDEETIQPKKMLSKKKLEAQELAARQKKKFDKTRLRSQSRTAYRLEMVKKKERELATAEEELEKQRAKMSNSVGGVNKNGVKFKIRERKR
jgi:U3 small nucleolar RNA-associated protein 11